MSNSKLRPFIGLTGGIGCGKTLVSDLFKQLGVFVVDTDIISHQIGETALFKEMALKIFGQNILSEEGAIDRKQLAKYFFSDENKKRVFESFIHPLIQAESLAQMSMIKENYGILVVPLLFEKETYLPFVARRLLVDCTEEKQIERVKVRNGITTEEAKNIITQQMPQAEKRKKADDILENNYDKTWVEQEVNRLHQMYRKMFC